MLGKLRPHRALPAALCAVLLGGLVACAPTPDGQVKPSANPTANGPVVLSWSVHGSPGVIAAYTRIAADYTAEHPGIVVNVRPQDGRAAQTRHLRELAAKDNLPSIFEISHADLSWLLADDRIEPVDELLVQRQVDFGDGFPRSAMNAFTAHARLQCMPTEVSPLVAYVNTSLINLPDLLGNPKGVYDPLRGWTLEQFAQAAQIASRRGHKGVYVEPSLEQVAPAIFSGGGSVVDDEENPTTLTLSDDASRDALQKLLTVVRNPRTTYTHKQLARRSAIDRFQRGELGILFGHRDLTAKLRQQGGLNFAVMPLPKVGTPATTARMSAMCLPKDSKTAEAAGDFLSYLVSEPAMQTLAATGQFVPTNLDVVNSEAFTQPNLMPENAGVFGDQLRRVRTLPDGPGWSTVTAQANGSLDKLFNDPVIEPLDERLQAIDEASATTLRTITDATGVN